MHHLYITFCLGLTAIGLISPSTAQASYVNSCELEGTIQSEPKHYRLYVNNADGLEIERIKSTFEFKVLSGKPSGRADSGCASQIGKTIAVELFDEPDFQTLHRKQTLRINERRMDDENFPEPTHEFSWIKSKNDH